MRKRKEYNEYPIPTCYWLNHCAVCGLDIVSGERYYDGGYNRRCHVECAAHDLHNKKGLNSAGKEGK